MKECDYIIDSIMKIISVVSSETAKVVIQLDNFLVALAVIPSMQMSIIFCYDYSRLASNSRETRPDKAKQTHREEVSYHSGDCTEMRHIRSQNCNRKQPW